MTSKPYILTLVMLLFIGACTRMNDVVLQDTQCPVAFSASFAEGNSPSVDTQWNDGLGFDSPLGVTKAMGEIAGVDDLRAKGFGVFACYTGLNRYAEVSVTADFMHNQEVTWDSEHEVWSYEPLKYWPNGEGELGEWGTASGKHYVSFFAYAPYSDADSENPESHPEGYCISSFCHPQEATDPWLLYRIHPNPAHQVDLLYATPLLDQVNQSVDNKLQFRLKHALSNYGEQLTVTVADDMKAKIDNGLGTLYDDCQLILNRVALGGTLTEKARLVLWNRGQANWQPVLSENTMITLTPLEVFSGEHLVYQSSTATKTSWKGSGCGIFYIPIEVSDNSQFATVYIQYTVRHIVDGEFTDTVYNGDVTLPLKDYSLEGKTLNINISIKTL